MSNTLPITHTLPIKSLVLMYPTVELADLSKENNSVKEYLIQNTGILKARIKPILKAIATAGPICKRLFASDEEQGKEEKSEGDIYIALQEVFEKIFEANIPNEIYDMFIHLTSQNLIRRSIATCYEDTIFYLVFYWDTEILKKFFKYVHTSIEDYKEMKVYDVSDKKYTFSTLHMYLMSSIRHCNKTHSFLSENVTYLEFVLYRCLLYKKSWNVVHLNPNRLWSESTRMTPIIYHSFKDETFPALE